MHKTFVAALVGAVLLAAGPAAAKPVTTDSCNKRYNACIDRCTARYGMDGKNRWASVKTVACIRRTCDKQLTQCLNSRTGGGKMEVPPPPPKGTGGHTPPIGGNKAEPNPHPTMNDNRGPLGGGLLDNGPVFSGQGPSATGSPLGGGAPAAPSAPPAAGPIFR